MFYILGVLYVFIALAIVADELFVPALEVLSEKWELSEDVAGATLMAAGGSSPELSTNLVATFLGSDVGFGTIVGSAVFNVLFVVGICAVLTNKEMRLNEWPIMRDSFFYMIAVGLLAIFFGISSGGRIDWYEALILHLFYWVYVGTMSYNTALRTYFYPISGGAQHEAVAIEMKSESSPDADADVDMQKQKVSDAEMSIHVGNDGVVTGVGHEEEAQDAFRQQSNDVAVKRASKHFMEVDVHSGSDPTPMLEHVLIGGGRARVRTSIVKLLVKHPENMLATTGVQTTKTGFVLEAIFSKYDPEDRATLK